MKKLLILLVAICLLPACATVKNTSANPSDVSFNFNNNGNTVLTFWKKVHPDGTVTGPFAVGVSQIKMIFNMRFPKAEYSLVKLDPGFYFMDSFQVNYGGKFFVPEGVRYDQRNGWDRKTNGPKYLSFTVKEGESLILPEVTVTPIEDKANPMVAKFRFNDPQGIFTLGSRVEKE